MTQQLNRNYLLTVLLFVLAFSAVDRQALGLIQQGIKLEFGLSDAQLGFLSGIAFALFYSIMGIPIARWADRGNRIAVLSITTALWSVVVILSGMVTSFVQLVLLRVLVGVGEAGCMPTAHSLIADTFNRAERPRAVAHYMLGGSLSVIVGYFFAGWLNQFYGWRTTLEALGLPGLALAALAWLTLKEPRLGRGGARVGQDLGGSPGPSAPSEVSRHDHPSLKEVLRLFVTNRTLLHLLTCFCVFSFFGQGVAQWQPSFFIRSYGLKTGELGVWFTIIYGVGSACGIYLGGVWASRRPNNEGAQLRTAALAYAGMGLISLCVYLARNQYVAFGLSALSVVGGSIALAPLMATVQTLLSDRMRATAIALIYLCSNLIGLGLGPLATGVVSDVLQAWAGPESLRYALLASSPGYVWGGWHLWRAAATVARDLPAEQGPRGAVAGSNTQMISA